MNNKEARDFREETGSASAEDTLEAANIDGVGVELDDAGVGNGQRDIAAEYLDALQRERASFLNYKRRTEQDREEAAYRAGANLLKKLLPVIDDFERALAHIPEDAKEVPWVEGVAAIGRKLNAVLESEGVERIESLGLPFDPNLHEAVAFDDNGSGHSDTVSEVYAHGYKVRDRVLRPAMVRVARG